MESVVIIGAGPSGLATAASLKRLGIPFTLWDRTGKPGGSFRAMGPTMKMLSPRRYVDLPYLPYPGAEEYPAMPSYAGYLEKYAAHFELKPEQEEVEAITRIENGFEIRCASNVTRRCLFLVIATGLFSHPVWPKIEGLAGQGTNTDKPIVMHACDWVAPNSLAGERVLIIGAGISGVSIAEECVQAGLRVLVSRRTNRTRLVRPRVFGIDILHWFRPLEFLPRSFFGSLCCHGVHPPAYDHGYSAAVKRGQITELPSIQRVKGATVEFSDGSRHTVDVIVAATGYRYQAPFLPPGIKRAPGGHPLATGCQVRDHPGLFLVGAPCARRIDSEFLRGIARDAVLVAQAIKAKLACKSSA